MGEAQEDKSQGIDRYLAERNSTKRGVAHGQKSWHAGLSLESGKGGWKLKVLGRPWQYPLFGQLVGI